jgi:hypothetical protein
MPRRRMLQWTACGAVLADLGWIGSAMLIPSVPVPPLFLELQGAGDLDRDRSAVPFAAIDRLSPSRLVGECRAVNFSMFPAVENPETGYAPVPPEETEYLYVPIVPENSDSVDCMLRRAGTRVRLSVSHSDAPRLLTF